MTEHPLLSVLLKQTVALDELGIPSQQNPLNIAVYDNALIFPETGTVSGRELSSFMAFKHCVYSLGALIHISMVWDT